MTVAVVLAGGLGTRIRHLHPELPKPMIPVAGRPFLGWVLRYLRAQGITRAVISAGYRAEVIEDWAATEPEPGLTVQVVREETPLGTAGGFRYALEALGPLEDKLAVVLNGDSLVLADLAPAIAAAQGPGADAALVGVEVEDASRFGSLEVDAQGRLVAFREKRPGAGLINAGVYVWRLAAMAARLPARTPLSFEHDVFPALVEAGALRAVAARAPFIDIGVPESLASAEDFVARHFA